MSRKGKGGHHGGSWKVALADFMTAMFALFLVMWLVNLKPEQKEGVAYYFKNYSVIKPNSGTPSIVKMKYDSGKAKKDTEGTKKYEKMTEQDMEKLQKNIEKQFRDTPDVLKNNIKFEKTDEGLRINLIDTTGNPLFEVGSNDLTAEGKRLIGIVGFEMRTYSTPVVIEGHTDSLKYAGQKYTNWELSTERALSARRELEKVGFSSDYIEKITGFADTKPLVDGDKANPQNRRISILVKK